MGFNTDDDIDEIMEEMERGSREIESMAAEIDAMISEWEMKQTDNQSF